MPGAIPSTKEVATLLKVQSALFHAFGFRFDRPELIAICEILYLESQNQFLIVPEIEAQLAEDYGIKLNRYRLNSRLLSLHERGLVDLHQEAVSEPSTFSRKLPILPTIALFTRMASLWAALAALTSNVATDGTPGTTYRGMKRFIEVRRQNCARLRSAAQELLPADSRASISASTRRKMLQDFQLDDSLWLSIAIIDALEKRGFHGEAGTSFDDLNYVLAHFLFMPTDNLRRALRQLSTEMNILTTLPGEDTRAVQYRLADHARGIVATAFGQCELGVFDPTLVDEMAPPAGGAWIAAARAVGEEANLR